MLNFWGGPHSANFGQRARESLSPERAYAPRELMPGESLCPERAYEPEGAYAPRELMSPRGLISRIFSKSSGSLKN